VADLRPGVCSQVVKKSSVDSRLTVSPRLRSSISAIVLMITAWVRAPVNCGRRGLGTFAFFPCTFTKYDRAEISLARVNTIFRTQPLSGFSARRALIGADADRFPLASFEAHGALAQRSASNSHCAARAHINKPTIATCTVSITRYPQLTPSSPLIQLATEPQTTLKKVNVHALERGAARLGMTKPIPRPAITGKISLMVFSPLCN